MGAFFGSIHVRTESSDTVQKALEQVAKGADCKFLLGPALNGWISVFPHNGGQSAEISTEIAKHLPHDIFHLVVHDDDIFCYYFYRNGQEVDQYNSCPDYFEKVSDEEKQKCQGHPELFQDLLRKPELLSKLKTLLAADGEKFTFEHERMEQFVDLLGLSNALSSYEYLQQGERDEIKGWKQFIHVPDLSAEKTAKRAAQALIKAEKKRLQKEGILLAEIKPPKEKGAGLPVSIAWGTDSTSNGLLLTWQSFHFTKPVDDKEHATEFFTIGPPWNTPLVPLGLKTNWTAHVFCMSPSANWLAGGFVAGDWAMRVWDWRRKELAFEVTHTRAVQWVEFSQDEQWVYSLGGGEFIITSLKEKRPIVTINGVEGARKAAVHPSGKVAVVNFQNQLGIIDVEKVQLIKKLWINRRMETLDPFAKDSKGTLIHTCLKTFLENPKIREKLGVGAELHAAILQDPKAVQKLNVDAQEKIKSMVEKVRSSSLISFETKENLFDLHFSPSGEQLFVASNGMRVFDWNKLLLANEDAPASELSVDAPKDNEDDPNSRPLAYSVCFDPERNLLLSSCLAGIIQYLNVKNGQSGTLLKPPGEVSIWRLELTHDRQALCCHSGSRPSIKNQNKRESYVQVWNYPALCKAAGLD
jgi:WD40 repeat protein